MAPILLAAVALAVAAASSSGDRADRPHIVVRKDIVSSTGEYLVRGQAFKAVYSVFNLGLDDALDVRVKDEWLASHFETISGKAAATWATLEGGANETFSIELRPKTVGVMRPSRASVDYQYIRKHESSGDGADSTDDDDEEEDDVVDVTGVSTAPWGGRAIDILTDSQFRELTASARIPASIAAVGAAAVVLYHYSQWSSARVALKAAFE